LTPDLTTFLRPTNLPLTFGTAALDTFLVMPRWNAHGQDEPRRLQNVTISIVMALLGAIWIWSQLTF
jgi:hypothetical protein